jgi:hypothetical protein
MKLWITTAMVMALASPAWAAKITNLDTVPHVVTFERAGSVQERTVQPQQSVLFQRADGMVGLKGGTAGTARVQSDGLLRGTIGDGRTTRIPSAPGDEFTIWPGGKMHIQRRVKSFTGR